MFCWMMWSCTKNEPQPIPIQKKDSTSTILTSKEYEDDNTWIYQQMKINYRWEDKMPEESKTNKLLPPAEYFKTLVYKEKDWFSYFHHDRNEVLNFWNGTPVAFGFRYREVLKDEFEKKEQLVISLVDKNSPAEKSGLKRGDIITKINGLPLSIKTNITEILAHNSIKFEGTHTDNQPFTISISKNKYQVDPILDYRIINENGRKIGYFAFGQFLSFIDDDLLRVFKYFKENQIDDLIVDLRFNPGGFTPNSEVVASFIVQNLNPSETMFGAITNSNQTEQYFKRFGTKEALRGWVPETYNLGYLPRVFMITSRSSSSSSELIISALKAKMNVITVGNNTFGKSVISTIITDETDKFPYVIMPAFSSYYNAKGQTENARPDGFIPDYKTDDNILPFVPIGNTNETLLRKTLDIISGKIEENQLSSGYHKVHFKDELHHYDNHNPFLTK